jgi:hypothetical protein
MNKVCLCFFFPWLASAAATQNKNPVTNDQEAMRQVGLDKKRRPLLNALAPVHFFAVLRALRLA